MTPSEECLLNFLKHRCFQRGTFKLASGKTSDHYLDIRAGSCQSNIACMIGECIYDRTKDLGLKAIGGMAIGAVPLVTAANIAFHYRGTLMEGFWVRDKQKDHGTEKRIEGVLLKGMRVAIVDDVFTSGGSALKAVEAAREAGAEVVTVLAVVDRLQGARELFAANGIENVQSLFTIHDFGVNPK